MASQMRADRERVTSLAINRYSYAIGNTTGDPATTVVLQYALEYTVYKRAMP
jgi:hypothetical protein